MKPSYWHIIRHGRFYFWGPNRCTFGLHREWWSWTWYLCLNLWVCSLTWELDG